MSSLPNIREYTVSELSYGLKVLLEKSFSNIRVRGEITGLKIADSGHVYFSLKDSGAVLNAICWRGVASKMEVALEGGLEVVCRGSITSYPGRSVYQMTVEQIEVAGVGALLKLLVERKARLAAEGLFASERKLPLPFLPKVIAVVTSPTGAVILDILHRIRERFPVQVLIWPVLVQGGEAAGQIAGAISGLQRMPAHIPQPDLIIVARGGGSIEDLWPFNEEIVVRAVSECKIPLISAVGHETDTTLIDLASDLRAPTPTAAAEMALPVLAELRQTLHHYQSRQLSAMRNLYRYKSSALEQLALRTRQIEKVLLAHQGALHNQWQRLQLHMTRLLSGVQSLLERAGRTLSPAQLQYRCSLYGEQLHSYHRRLEQGMDTSLISYGRELTHLSALLESYGHENVLKRGFALVRSGGQVLTSAQSLRQHSRLEIIMHDGTVPIMVVE